MKKERLSIVYTQFSITKTVFKKMGYLSYICYY